MTATVSRLGIWAAIATVALSALSFGIGILTPARGGPFCPADCVPFPYVNAAAFIPTDYIWIVPAILLVPTFMVLMACINGTLSDDQRLFGHLGWSFALVYAAVIGVDYFIQFTVVVPSLQTGQVDGLSLFTMYNPHGLFVALESLGYLALSAALLCVAPVFRGSRTRRTIRWLFVIGFVMAIAAFTGLALAGSDIVAFEVAILSIDWIVLILGGALLALTFRRSEPDMARPGP